MKLNEEQQAIEADRIREAINNLRQHRDFPTYENEIKSLVKSVVIQIVNTKPMDDKLIKKLLYLQGQLDILISVFGVTVEQIAEDINEEQFT